MRFGNKFVEIDQSIKTFPSTAKLPHNKIRYNALLSSPIEKPTSASEMFINPATDKEIDAILEAAPKPELRRSTRNTRWIPDKPRSILKLLAVSLTLLPNVIIAEPASGFAPKPHSEAMAHHADTFKPMEQTPQWDKLRAYHAALDRWNLLVNPSAEDHHWIMQNIVTHRAAVRWKASQVFSSKSSLRMMTWLGIRLTH